MKTKFSTISSIDLDKPYSWQDSVFITLDIDWCHDEVLGHSINLLEQAGASATWFITHDTPLLERLRANPKFELGIHPNFNFLLEGDSRNGKNAEEVVDLLLEIVPEALSVRSHSMTQSSRLLDLFKVKGLQYDCNSYNPSGFCTPWRVWNDLIKVPHCWEDDLSLAYSAELTVPDKGLRVYDFHPIHIFLNTKNLTTYEESRAFHNDPNKLKRFRNQSNGVCDWFVDLISRRKISEL